MSSIPFRSSASNASVPALESTVSHAPRPWRLALLAAAAAVLSLAAGCGGGTDAHPAAATAAGTAADNSTGNSTGDGASGGAANDPGAAASAPGTSSGGADGNGSSGDVSAGNGGTADAGTGASGGMSAIDDSDADAVAALQGTGARDTIAAVAGGGAASADSLANGGQVLPTNYTVGGTTAVQGSTRVASMMAVPWGALPPGSVVYVNAGTYAGVNTIMAVGSKAAPIVVTAADPAHPPLFTNSFDIQHSSYVQLSHVYIQQPTYSGVIIRFGSDHVTVSDSTISQAPVGITITGAAGTGHQILRNTISASVAHGISVEVNADPAERTLIQRNTVLSSGQHGMEIRASHYQVEYNTVGYSGAGGGGGISGIHLYSGSPSEDSGDDNLVRYNMTYNSVDKVAFDGNGIEVDQWCDGNTVAYNQAWGNDGAGIIVFDGSNNVVQNNTAWDNNVDSGHTHVSKGEIIVSGTAAATAHGNRVWNNLAYSTRVTVPALYVDTRAVAGGNTIGANLYWNSAVGGQVVRWTDSTLKQTAAAIDATTGVPGSVVALPAFINVAARLTGGLKLALAPAKPGVQPAGQVDFAGIVSTATQSYLGAYFTGL